MGIAVSQNEDPNAVMANLKVICTQYGINNPCVGEERYNPNQYDATKQP